MTDSEADRIVGLYERHAATWDESRSQSLFEHPWLQKFQALLPEGGAILELGCGSGEPIAGYFIRAGYGLRGIDSSPAMIAFCKARFGVSFPLFAKAPVTGKDAQPVFKQLAAAKGAPQWNFHKYLVGKDGEVLAAFPSKVAPDDPKLLAAACDAIAAWADSSRATVNGIGVSKGGCSILVGLKRADLAAEPAAWGNGTPDLVTAAALFDLVSEEWIERFVSAVTRAKAVFYTALTHSSAAVWSPPFDPNWSDVVVTRWSGPVCFCSWAIAIVSDIRALALASARSAWRVEVASDRLDNPSRPTANTVSSTISDSEMTKAKPRGTRRAKTR